MPLTKYVDLLPIPPVLKPKGRRFGTTYYTVKMKEIKQKLHRDLNPTKLWGYEGIYPGPTIEVNRNCKTKIKWENHLPVNEHLLPVDTSILSDPDMPMVRTVVHLHGANVEADSDGYPDAWYTNNFEVTGHHFKKKVYEYTNRQQATTLWYHDHSMGTTRLNVYAGLAGIYIIHDKHERSLNLPKGKYDIPLVIQDKSFNEDGSLAYPVQPQNPSPTLPNPSIVPGFLGDTILVNGKVWPYLEVEPRKYRFRLLNASNGRIYNLSLSAGEDQPVPTCQIGSDGGLLERPVELTQLIMAPSERAEIIIDFKEYAGKNILLLNSQAPVDSETTGQIMQFRVRKCCKRPDNSRFPCRLNTIKPLKKCKAVETRDMTIRVLPDGFGRPKFTLNGMLFHDPVTEKPILGTTEIWNIINSGLGIHPVHVHLIQFQVMNRQAFDVALYNSTGELEFTADPIEPDPNERGWKDTVKAIPGFVTRIIIRFHGYSGLYVWHCHILEHEDYDMMRPLEVIKKPKKESKNMLQIFSVKKNRNKNKKYK